MPTEHLVTLIVGLLGSGGAASWIAEYLRKRRKDREKRALEAMWSGHTRVYEAMNSMLHATAANRVMVLIAENNGGVPSAGHPVFITCIYEAHDLQVPSVKTDWDRRKIDGQYAKLIAELVVDQSVELRVSRMRSGELKTLYESHDIKRAWVRLLSQTPKRLVYVSAVSQHPEDLTAKERAAMDACSHQLRRVIEDGDQFAVRQEQA